MNNDVQLSKWWRTPSARAAFKRVEDQKKEQFAKLKAKKKADREAREKELAEWEEKPLDSKQKRAKGKPRT